MEEENQVMKEPQGEAAQVLQITKKTTTSNERTTRRSRTSAMNNYKEHKESRSW